jgi:hypothetical protein
LVSREREREKQETRKKTKTIKEISILGACTIYYLPPEFLDGISSTTNVEYTRDRNSREEKDDTDAVAEAEAVEL